MVAYFDTSLLFNLYVPQATGVPDVGSLIRGAGGSALTQFGYMELCNAFRLSRFRNQLSDQELTSTLDRLNRHLRASIYVWLEPAWQDVFNRADQISDQVSVETGIRSMDLFHLATASVAEVTDFYSSDQRQCDAAEKIGFVVHRNGRKS